MYDRRGRLFNHKFKRKKIKSGEYLRQVKAYIHLNPVHHEFVPKLYDRKYFSYHSFLVLNKLKLIKMKYLSYVRF